MNMIQEWGQMHRRGPHGCISFLSRILFLLLRERMIYVLKPSSFVSVGGREEGEFDSGSVSLVS